MNPARTTFPADECACRVILGEAANQGPLGMLAVAAVIQNRLKRGGWYGVDVYDVTRPSQFNGFDYISSRSSDAYVMAAKCWAMAKEGADPTRGAIFYANPRYSTAAWARNLCLQNALQIGAHFFTDNVDGHPFDHAGEVVTEYDGLVLAHTLIA